MEVNINKSDLILKTKKRVDWDKIIDEEKKISFQYDTITGYFIIDYSSKKNYIKVKYKDREKEIYKSSFLKGKRLKDLIKGNNSFYSFTVGTVLDSKIKIIEQVRNENRHKAYNIICLDCDKTFNREETALKNNKKCPFCNNSIKFPERFTSSLLNTININYETQKIFEWSKETKNGKKIYDFYFKFKGEDFIIETNGEQHYKKGFERCGGRTLEEEQANDKYKYELAISNGIKPENYIVIDFRESTLEWGKEHILNSRLGIIFDLTNFDWDKCYEDSNINKKKECLKIIQKEEYTYEELSSLLNISISTLKKWISDFKKSDIENLNIIDKRSYHSKKVICINNNKIFNSIQECYDYFTEVLNINISSPATITNICNKLNSNVEGYVFEYVDEKDKNSIYDEELYNRVLKMWNEGKDNAFISKKLNINTRVGSKYLKEAERRGDIKNLKEEIALRSGMKGSLKGRKIFCKELNITFLNIKELKEYFKEKHDMEMLSSEISRSCKKDKSYKGYHFKYIEKERNQCLLDY